jgi:hypothetical protein
MVTLDDLDEKQVECVACGATFAPEDARAYAVDEETFLCWACSLDRGGKFDAQRDCWVRPPDVRGLHTHP